MTDTTDRAARLAEIRDAAQAKGSSFICDRPSCVLCARLRFLLNIIDEMAERSEPLPHTVTWGGSADDFDRVVADARLGATLREHKTVLAVFTRYPALVAHHLDLKLADVKACAAALAPLIEQEEK